MAVMQHSILWTLLSMVWLSCAISLPDNVISSSSASNDNELRISSVSSNSLSDERFSTAAVQGYLLSSVYTDSQCKTLNYAVGTRLGVCEYSQDSNNNYIVTSVVGKKAWRTYYNDKECLDYSRNETAFTVNGACSQLSTVSVLPTRVFSAAGYLEK